jgi:N-acetylglucosaminyl-diphospho-decaprenol L-rhamnosyltransferase
VNIHPQPPEITAGNARLTILVVNYESWADTARLAAALSDEPEFRAGSCKLIIVDNDSRGPIAASLDKPQSGIQVIRRPDNGGFAVGVNTGWHAARSPWLLLLNPDVEIAPGFLHRVFDQLDHYASDSGPTPGIVGFALRNADGSTQGSVGAFPTLARALWEQLLPRSRRKYQSGWRIHPGPVDWVTGACMLVSSSMMEQLHGMNEDFFLYYEEVALCRSAQNRGWKVLYDSSVEVIHRHPLQNRAISPKIRVITRHSKLLYFLEHLPRWQFLVLSVIVSGEALFQALRAKAVGNEEELRAWRSIAQMSRRFREGVPPLGRDVLTLAESVVQVPAGGPARAPVPMTARPHAVDRHGRTREHSA